LLFNRFDCLSITVVVAVARFFFQRLSFLAKVDTGVFDFELDNVLDFVGVDSI
jgi:hypothetical protein